MVRKIRFSTRCITTMIAGSPLRDLLHGRRSAPVPDLLPLRQPTSADCPWTSIGQSLDACSMHTTTYSAIVRLSTRPRQQCFHLRLLLPSPPPQVPPPRPFFARPLRRGTLRWQTLLRRLESTSLSKIVTAQAHPNMAFDAIDHWLPLPSLMGFRDIHRDLTQGNPVSGLTLAAETTDDDADHAMPRDPNFLRHRRYPYICSR